MMVRIHSVDIKGRRIALRHLASAEEEEIQDHYTAEDEDIKSYNPFAAMLKEK